MTDAEDKAAVESVLAGDGEAYEAIVRRWQGPLVNLAYRFCRDAGTSEEMAQDALVRAFRGLSRWRREGRFSTWLFAVALNVYRSQLRRARVAAVPLDAVRFLADSRLVDREFEAEDRAELVRRSVLSLPQRYRDALVLFYFHDMSVEEAARTLGIAQGTLKAQLHRGREMLRRKLGGLIPPGEIEEG